MSRVVVLVGVLVAVVAAMVWLAGRDTEQPQQRIETQLPENAIGR